MDEEKEPIGQNPENDENIVEPDKIESEQAMQPSEKPQNPIEQERADVLTRVTLSANYIATILEVLNTPADIRKVRKACSEEFQERVPYLVDDFPNRVDYWLKTVQKNRDTVRALTKKGPEEIVAQARLEWPENRRRLEGELVYSPRLSSSDGIVIIVPEDNFPLTNGLHVAHTPFSYIRQDLPHEAQSKTARHEIEHGRLDGLFWDVGYTRSLSFLQRELNRLPQGVTEGIARSVKRKMEWRLQGEFASCLVSDRGIFPTSFISSEESMDQAIFGRVRRKPPGSFASVFHPAHHMIKSIDAMPIDRQDEYQVATISDLKKIPERALKMIRVLQGSIARGQINEDNYRKYLGIVLCLPLKNYRLINTIAERMKGDFSRRTHLGQFIWYK